MLGFMFKLCETIPLKHTEVNEPLSPVLHRLKQIDSPQHKLNDVEFGVHPAPDVVYENFNAYPHPLFKYNSDVATP